MTGTNDSAPFVSLHLTRAEALVLFEWLARVDAAEKLPVEHAAEQEVLWRLEAQLEKALPELLAPHYPAALDAARREVAPSNEGP